jgi:hypothetical protein
LELELGLVHSDGRDARAFMIVCRGIRSLDDAFLRCCEPKGPALRNERKGDVGNEATGGASSW